MVAVYNNKGTKILLGKKTVPISALNSLQVKDSTTTHNCGWECNDRWRRKSILVYTENKHNQFERKKIGEASKKTCPTMKHISRVLEMKNIIKR
jgi:hypothetical protein